MPRRKQTRPKRMKYSDDGKEEVDCNDTNCEDDDAELGDDEDEDDTEEGALSDSEESRPVSEKKDDDDDELPHKTPSIYSTAPPPESSRYLMPDSSPPVREPAMPEPLATTSMLSSFVEERLKSTSMSLSLLPRESLPEPDQVKAPPVVPSSEARRHFHRHKDRSDRAQDKNNHKSNKSGVIRKTPSIQNEHLREIEKLISMSKPKDSHRISPKSRMYPTSPKSSTPHKTPSKADYLQHEEPRPKSPDSLYLDPFETDQPLDLSKKPKEMESNSRSSSSITAPVPPRESYSLANLEKKFGGNAFLFDGLGSKFSSHRNSMYGAFGGNLFTSALYNTPPLANPADTVYRPNRSFWPNVMGTAAQAVSKSFPSTPVKPKPPVVSMETKPKPEAEVRVQRETREDLGSSSGRYTNLTCSCRKAFETLYELTIHMQKTGHLPTPMKTCDQSEYPKLVRGQDMWLNQGSEQTRQILRCMQCGESFKSLPELTIHMMNTKHYTNIVGSDSGRKQHKCSTYCEKCPNEHDSPPLKCKYCLGNFDDMDLLSKHMISCHYKRQSPPTEGEHQYLQQECYYSNKETPPPKVIKPIENDSNDASRQSNNTNHDNSDSESDDMFECSKIRCENCLEKIDTPNFVEHVRVCVKTKPRVLDEDRNGSRANADVPVPASYNSRPKSERRNEVEGPTQTPSPPTLSPLQRYPTPGEARYSKSNGSQYSDSYPPFMDKEFLSPKREDYSSRNGITSPLKANEGSQDGLRERKRSSSRDTPQPRSRKHSHTEDGYFDFSRRSSEDTPTDHLGRSRTKEGGNSPLAPALHSTTPDLEPASSEGSALKAMENFIERSFTSSMSKMGSYGSRALLNGRMNLRMPGQTSHMHRYLSSEPSALTSPQRPPSQQRYLNPSPPSQPLPPVIKKEAPESPKAKDPCEPVPIKKEKNSPPGSPDPTQSVSLAKRENGERASPALPKEQYLQDSAQPATPKNSALESLQGLVYGKSFSTEHPLDSLQKLIHNTDGIATANNNTNGTKSHVIAGSTNLATGLPNTVILVNPIVTVVPSNSAPPAVQISMPGTDGPVTTPSPPLNGFGSGASKSPLSEGEADQLGDYRCQACNRSFASKGSYRYHLSRCHLSSVKRYGIKEAFNMSPYVYLPLDHTAKFNKYYEMANELANKGKLKEAEAAAEVV